MPTIHTTCKGCKKPFKTFRSPSYLAKYPGLYCSRACFLNSWEKAELFICAECGQEFTARRTKDRPNPKFCSRACRNKNIAAIIDFVCPECGIVFQRHQSVYTRYCSKTCAGKHSYVVQHNPKYEERHCRHCGEVMAGKGAWRRRQFCDTTCRTAHAEDIPREDYLEILRIEDAEMQVVLGYRGDNWPQQRRNARHRDHYRCQRCGKHERELGRELSVHHIRPFREFGLENYKVANTLSNLVSLCSPCHKHVEQIGWAIEQRKLL